MAETRTTLTIYPSAAAFLEGHRCAAAGNSASRRIDLMAARFMVILDHVVATRDFPSPQEWVALDRAARDVAFDRAEDPLLLPAVVKLAIRRQPVAEHPGASAALSSVSYKLDQAGPALLFGLADVLERWRVAVPAVAERTAESFSEFAAGLDLGATKTA